MKVRHVALALTSRGIWAVGVALAGIFAFSGAASASSNLNISAQDRSVLVTWSPPAGASGFTLSANATDGSAQFNCKSSTTTCVISGLANGVAYQVKAQVTDASGPIDSASASVTPFGPPGAPQLLSAQAGDGRVTGTWSPGGANGSLVTSYVMSASAGGSSTSCTTTATSCTVAGLTDGTAYSVSVVARNAGGSSVPSNAIAATPAGPPGAPIGVRTALNSQDQLVIVWDAPADDGGAPISSYTIWYSTDLGSSWTSVGTATALSYTDAANPPTSSYLFSVAATNAAGTGGRSGASGASPVIVASATSSVVTASETSRLIGKRVTITVTLRDTNGYPVAGKTVAMGSKRVVTDSAGVASFSLTSRRHGVVTYTAIDVSDSVTLAQRVSVTFTAPPGPGTTTSSLVGTTTSVATTTTSAPTTTSSGGTTTSVATTTTLPIAVTGVVSIAFNADAGFSVHSYHILINGRGLAPGSVAHISVHSTPRLLASVLVSSVGVLHTSVRLPRDLGVGVHHLIVNATSAAGAALTSTYAFTVVRGNLVGALKTIPRGPTAAYAVFTPSAHRGEVLSDTVGLLMAIAAIAAGLGRKTRARGGAWLEDVEVERVGAAQSGAAPADTRSWLERFSRRGPDKVAKTSPVAGRVLADGDYLRATLGRGWLVLCASAVALGVIAADNSNWYSVSPALWLFLVILGLGVLDATLGYLAGLAFFGAIALAGHLDTASAWRVAMGLVLIWFAVPLAAGAIRPLRRLVARGTGGVLMRGADVLIAGLFAAWMAAKMVEALSALAGVELPIGRDLSVVAVAAGVLVGLRMVAESLVARYSSSLHRVTPEGTLESGRLQISVSLVIQVGLFVFISLAAFSASWPLYVGTAVFFAPLVAWLFVDHIPKSRWLSAHQPSALVRWSVIITLEVIIAWALYRSGLSNARAEEIGFVVLPLPVLASWTSELFIVEEDEEESEEPRAASALTWTRVVGGAALIAVPAALILLGVSGR